MNYMQNDFWNKKIVVYLVTIAANMLAGLCALGSKITLEELSTIQVLAGRWLVAVLAFVSLMAVGNVKITFKGKNLKLLIAIALIQPTLSSFSEIVGINLTTASQASIMNALIPATVTVLSALLFKRKIHRRTAIGVGLSFLGMILIIVPNEDFNLGGAPLGYIALVVMVLCGAVYALSSSQATKTFSPIEVAFVQSLIGCVVFNSVAFVQEGGFSWYKLCFTHPESGLGILYLGVIGSCFVYIVMNYTLSKIAAEKATLLQLSIMCVTGVAAGIVVLGDGFGLYTIAGMAVVFCGVLLANKQG